MKTRLIVDSRSRLKLPDAFDIKKYDICKRWSIEEWYRAILYRSSLRRNWNRSVRKYFDAEDILPIYDKFKKQARLLIEAPIEQADNRLTFGTAHLIKDQSVADLFEDAEDSRILDSSYRTDYIKWSEIGIISRSLDENKHLVDRVANTPTWKMKRDEYGETGRASIYVNLHGDNRDIIGAFEAWLNKTKKEMNLPKASGKYDDSVFSDWCNDRVLPCFDLVFYETVHNGYLDLSDLAKALFPVAIKDISYEDSIKRTVRPKSLKIVSSATVAALTKALTELKPTVPANTKCAQPNRS